MQLFLWTQRRREELDWNNEEEEDLSRQDPAMFSYVGLDAIYVRRWSHSPCFPFGELNHEVLHKVIDLLGEEPASLSMDRIVSEESLDGNGWVRKECARCPYVAKGLISEGCWNCPVWEAMRQRYDVA